jgi:hypothetical protein
MTNHTDPLRTPFIATLVTTLHQGRTCLAQMKREQRRVQTPLFL